MWRNVVLSGVATCCLGLVLSSLAWAGPTRDADLVVLGDIRTMADERPRAGGLAVRDGTIVYVGSAREASKRLRAGGRLIELASGHSVLPGLIDSHVHMLDAGLLAQRCALSDEEIKDRAGMF